MTSTIPLASCGNTRLGFPQTYTCHGLHRYLAQRPEDTASGMATFNRGFLAFAFPSPFAFAFALAFAIAFDLATSPVAAAPTALGVNKSP